MTLTSDPDDPRLTRGVDREPVDQAAAYLVLSETDRARGLQRPVRGAYWHASCATVTTMAPAIAETYARDPGFYGATYCVACRRHLPVGAGGDFFWADVHGQPTSDKVGT